MCTSEKMGKDGLASPDTGEEMEPEAAKAIKREVTVSDSEYKPRTMQETVEDRTSKSQIETDRIARWVLVGCLVLIGASHIAQLIAGWVSEPLFSDGANATLDTIKYVATIVMGYLFGKRLLAQANNGLTNDEVAVLQCPGRIDAAAASVIN